MPLCSKLHEAKSLLKNVPFLTTSAEFLFISTDRMLEISTLVSFVSTSKMTYIFGCCGQPKVIGSEDDNDGVLTPFLNVYY